MQFVRNCRTLLVVTAAVRLSFEFPSVGMSSRIVVPFEKRKKQREWYYHRTIILYVILPVCNRRSLSDELANFWNGCVKVWSKLSSWLPAITSLCLCGSCPKNNRIWTYVSLSYCHLELTNPCVKFDNFFFSSTFGKITGMNENITIWNIEFDMRC